MTWVIVGAGAQGRVVLDTLRAAFPTAHVVFLDDAPMLAGRSVEDVPIVGREWLNGRTADAVGVVAVGRNDARLRLADELARRGLAFASLVHPSATVTASATLGVGTWVAAGAVVNAGARVGEHVIVNTRAVVEHDCVIGRGASLSPGVVMGGRVTVEDEAFVGVGAMLVSRVRVGAGAIVGAGAVVMRDVPPGVVAYGSPARVVRPVDRERDWPRLL